MELKTQTNDAPTRPVDQFVLDLLRREEGLSVTDLMERLEVTATAIRQRLDRLEESGLIERRKQSVGRGRPSFNYFLTGKGARQAGVTYNDLAIALWNEIKLIDSPEVKKTLMGRVSERMGGTFRELLSGGPLEDRMLMMAGLLSDRRIPTCMTHGYGLPVLEVQACPYPDLVGSEHDRSVCNLETKVLSTALGHEMELSQCRLDGHSCCQFKPTVAVLSSPSAHTPVAIAPS